MLTATDCKIAGEPSTSLFPKICLCSSNPYELVLGSSSSQWVEWRADLLGFEPHDSLDNSKILWTYRTKEEIYPHHQIGDQLIKALHTMPLVDMQLIRDEVLLRTLRHVLQKKVVLSVHDQYQGLDHLERLLSKMRLFPRVKYWKIALDFRKASFKDLLDAFCFLKKLPSHWKEKILFIPMDARWSFARLWSASHFAPFLFCCFQEATSVASGQPSLETSLAVQRERASGNFYALLGSSVKQSPSHLSHNAVFKQIDPSSRYLKMALEETDVIELLDHLGDVGLQGFSVTMPYKELVFSKIKEMSDLAQRCQAVNFLQFKDGQWQGDNTDARAFIDLFTFYKISAFSKVLVLGAGGSARSAIVALSDFKAEITVVSRNIQRAFDLIDFFDSSLKIKAGSFDQPEIWQSLDYDIIIQTTPLGLKQDDIYPFDLRQLSKKALLIELVNGSLTKEKEASSFELTPLAIYWKDLKRPYVTAKEFFIRQASYQLGFWSKAKAEESYSLLHDFFNKAE